MFWIEVSDSLFWSWFWTIYLHGLIVGAVVTFLGVAREVAMERHEVAQVNAQRRRMYEKAGNDPSRVEQRKPDYDSACDTAFALSMSAGLWPLVLAVTALAAVVWGPWKLATGGFGAWYSWRSDCEETAERNSPEGLRRRCRDLADELDRMAGSYDNDEAVSAAALRSAAQMVRPT